MDGDPLTYVWTQSSGTAVTLSSTGVSNPTFIAPDVDGNEDLVFSLTVTAGGASVSDEVTISIANVSLPSFASAFESDSLVSDPELVSCIVGGTSTTCLSVQLKSSPGGTFTVGPFCPRSTADTEEDSGIWYTSVDTTIHDVDGAFITNLSTLYDSSWQMFDPATNEVFYTETAAECQVAANPDPDPDLFNHCVECLVEYLDEGLSQTYLIPLNPVDATNANTRTSFGIAFSGVVFDRSAPISLIESNNNIAPFDDCGGHINPNVGYHIHAVTDAGCLAIIENDRGHAAQIGVALHGYPMFERLNGETEPTDLDQCRGHDSDAATYNLGVGYHYHVNAPGENAVLPCLTGELPQ